MIDNTPDGGTLRRTVLEKGTALVFISGALAGCVGDGGDDDETDGTDDDSASQPANFDVQTVDPPHEVDEGEEIRVHFTVQNIGEQAEGQDIHLEIDGSTEESIENVELEPQETFSDTFTYTASGDDAPEVDIAVVTEDDRPERAVIVDPDPPVEALEMTIADITELDVGLTSATITILFEVENTHGEWEVPSPTIDYNAYIEGQEVASAREDIASLGPGDSTEETFELNASYVDLGSAVVDAIQAESFTVTISGTVESEDVSTDFETMYVFG